MESANTQQTSYSIQEPVLSLRRPRVADADPKRSRVGKKRTLNVTRIMKSQSDDASQVRSTKNKRVKLSFGEEHLKLLKPRALSRLSVGAETKQATPVSQSQVQTKKRDAKKIHKIPKSKSQSKSRIQNLILKNASSSSEKFTAHHQSEIELPEENNESRVTSMLSLVNTTDRTHALDGTLTSQDFNTQRRTLLPAGKSFFQDLSPEPRDIFENDADKESVLTDKVHEILMIKK